MRTRNTTRRRTSIEELEQRLLELELNYTGLREENNQLRRVNQELEQRIEQIEGPERVKNPRPVARPNPRKEERLIYQQEDLPVYFYNERIEHPIFCAEHIAIGETVRVTNSTNPLEVYGEVTRIEIDRAYFTFTGPTRRPTYRIFENLQVFVEE